MVKSAKAKARAHKAEAFPKARDLEAQRAARAKLAARRARPLTEMLTEAGIKIKPDFEDPFGETDIAEK